MNTGGITVIAISMNVVGKCLRLKKNEFFIVENRSFSNLACTAKTYLNAPIIINKTAASISSKIFALSLPTLNENMIKARHQDIINANINHMQLLCLKLFLNSLKKVLKIYPSSPRIDFIDTDISAVVDAPIVIIGMLHITKRICSSIRSNAFSNSLIKGPS